MQRHHLMTRLYQLQIRLGYWLARHLLPELHPLAFLQLQLRVQQFLLLGALLAVLISVIIFIMGQPLVPVGSQP